jgi:hypothetical protein
MQQQAPGWWDNVGAMPSAPAKGNTLWVQQWDRREGELEVSPTKVEAHDLRALLQR